MEVPGDADAVNTLGVAGLAALAGGAANWLWQRWREVSEQKQLRIGRRRTDTILEWQRLNEKLEAQVVTNAAEIKQLRADNLVCETRAARLAAELEFVKADLAELRQAVIEHGIRPSGLIRAAPPSPPRDQHP